MTIQIFIQARLDSKRLPKKILKTILNKTVLEHIVIQSRKIKNIDNVILVTGSKEKNQLLIEKAQQIGIETFSGNDENILDRFYNASKKFNPTTIIRLTGDNPLIDYQIINHALEVFAENEPDILSVNRVHSFPKGINFEIFSLNALKKSWEQTVKNFDHSEFSHKFINPVNNLLESPSFVNYDFISKKKYPEIRLTMDYKEDFEFISKIYEGINSKNITLDNIVDFLNKHPKTNEINSQYNESKK